MGTRQVSACPLPSVLLIIRVVSWSETRDLGPRNLPTHPCHACYVQKRCESWNACDLLAERHFKPTKAQ